VLCIDGILIRVHIPALEDTMTENVKLPRKLSEERASPPPRRPSHARVIEDLDRWANSPGLQPPETSGEKRA